MNREIKFRAWNGEKMLYNFDMTSKGKCGEYGQTSGGDYWDVRLYEVGIKELMQYTGLKDKNGTDIYEGDIVRDTEYKAIQEVVWKNNGFKLKYTFQNSYMGEKYMETKYLELRETDSRRWGVEVIGNVFENPELLESEVE